MFYSGQAIQGEFKNKIAYVKFDNQDQSANVFNTKSIKELGEVYTKVEALDGCEGLIFYSGKNHFVLGADITEFLGLFKSSDSEILSWLKETNQLFSKFEDLNYPTVSAINGFALGGGLEICLTTCFRVATQSAKIGLPETKLGIMPGWGGTVRLGRIAGADHAIEWVAGGKQYKAEDAFKLGIVDAVIDDKEDIVKACETIIQRANQAELDWKKARDNKKGPLKLQMMEKPMVFETSKAFVKAQGGEHYIAPFLAVEAMEKGAFSQRDQAIDFESQAFIKCAKSDTADSLIQVFLGDQYLKKISKKHTKNAAKIEMPAVLGAGIMGGGIAYQTASKGLPVVMKDIKQEALDLGMDVANSLLQKQLKRKKINTEKLGKVISQITPVLETGELKKCDFIVEAVVENEGVKKSVLKEMEGIIPDNSILASNTSTISISALAKGLDRPENFCGMHFFNPVHRMPLVEIIKGEKTSDLTVSKAVQYATQIGKTPIVVNDCAGFLVNRVLFPYFFGFFKLVEDGVDFRVIDKAMEKFGWPMGPAYLLDVVGIDTAFHCTDIMAEAFPDRMKFDDRTIAQELFENKRFGQKNGVGFYQYQKDRKGKLKKEYDESIQQYLGKIENKKVDANENEIVERMMLPMIFESIRCLSDNIVATAIECDMAMLLGLGFPPFRVGPLKFAQDWGLDNVIEAAKKYQELGALYHVPELLIKTVEDKSKFYKN